ncbi:hypothetical protein TSUD_50200 [Trifolium subterraneum]|uniref:DUF1639 domain-containing protein n=1 Tax=Trifolium subterraneum TaxID=3900 RepID=A0A2Z6LLW3_TRISU|nr:hypothetical protein TSUD_50200 [Trifolium subterraneum]
MVFSGEEENNTMGTGSGGERVKPLHNFMLPCLKWGTQRHLRCMKIPSGDGSSSDEVENGDAAGEGSMAGEKTWNLRTRRGAAATAGESTGKGLKIDEKKPNGSPLRNVNGGGSKLRGGGGGGSPQRVKFSLALSKKEIEEDFLKMTGNRPPRRPKKRARNVQKNMDTLFPGMWLSDVTPDMYKVADDSETGKIAGSDNSLG